MPHPCPVPGCPDQVPSRNIACQAHWHKLPATLRREWVESSYDRHSMRHLRAVTACIEWLFNRVKA